MNVSIHWSGIPSSADLREHLERRVGFALGRFGDEISEVHARLADVNGPRGGVDKGVRLQIHGRRVDSLIVTDRDADLRTAIDRAADRLGRTVGRVLSRFRTRRRGAARDRDHDHPLMD